MLVFNPALFNFDASQAVTYCAWLFWCSNVAIFSRQSVLQLHHIDKKERSIRNHFVIHVAKIHKKSPSSLRCGIPDYASHFVHALKSYGDAPIKQ